MPAALARFMLDQDPRLLLLAAIVCALGTVAALIGLGVTVVVHRRRLAGLAAQAERLRTLADGAFEGLVVHRDGVVVDANAAARRLFGLETQEPEQRLGPFIDALVGAGVEGSSGGDGPSEVMLRRADGTPFPAEVCRRRLLLDDGSDGELCAIRDLSARKESEARAAHLALHDALTDMPNRRFFMEFAHKTLSHARRTGDRFAVLTLDLDDFKEVNDTHGHAAGDELIRVASQRIAATLREADACARFGGDEFAILATGTSQPTQAMALAERLTAALQAPIPLPYGELTITVSVGISLYPDDGASVEELLRNADTAMYRAKADGKATSRFFEPHMDADLVARRRVEKGLRGAVAENRLTLAYQPVVDAHARVPTGFEALVRWQDEELGTVTPDDFIPVAEETGLIVPLGALVVRRACMEAAAWPAHLRVAVNLSAVQFRRPGLVEMVRGALEESGLPGERLELEVTETLLVESRQDALRQLKELKDLGVRISMDDFGTGYSALSYLQCFPFDKIKIDRLFTADLADNPQHASIVGAVAAMGRSLRMRVVAEGVETDRDADVLIQLGCDEIQGYLIARPMGAADVAAFLRDSAPSPPPAPPLAATA